MHTLTSAGRDPVIWAERVLRLHGMPEEEIRAVLDAGDQEIIRRYFELHRERLQERFDDQLRALGVLETRLARGSRGDVTR